MVAYSSVVADTSCIMAVLFAEPLRERIVAATRGHRLLAPASVTWEVGNATVAAVRRRRLAPDQARTVWESFRQMEIEPVEVDIGEAIDLAIEMGLCAFDGYVIEAARQHRVPLLTLDMQLARAAAATGVSLVEVLP